jgi:predicted nucleic acid-binding protein
MPSSDASRLYWDSSVFLSLVNDEPGRRVVLDAILTRVRASAGKEEIVTSTLSITEVAFGAEEQLGEPLDAVVEDQINALWDDPFVIKLREFDRLIARDARRLIRLARDRRWSLKPADAIHLASARSLNVTEFQTYDHGLFKYEELAGFTIRQPYSQQLLLL